MNEAILTRPLIVFALALLSLHGSGFINGPCGERPSDSVLDKEIGPLHIDQFGAYNALAQISRETGIPIGVDAIQPKHESTITFDFQGGKVSDMLSVFASQAPDYAWRDEADGFVRVSRRGAGVSLLDVVVSYSGARDKTRQEISRSISQLPEVSAWLSSHRCSREEFSHGGEFREHNAPISLEPGRLTLGSLLDEVAIKSGSNYWAVLQTQRSGQCGLTILQ